MNNKKDKRLLGEIATVIVITVLIIAYYIFYFFALAYLLEGSALRIIMGILPLLFSVIMIRVCLERIKEIKEDDTDDLSKY